jgi:hypothetical protein
MAINQDTERPDLLPRVPSARDKRSHIRATIRPRCESDVKISPDIVLINPRCTVARILTVVRKMLAETPAVGSKKTPTGAIYLIFDGQIGIISTVTIGDIAKGVGEDGVREISIQYVREETFG